MRDLPLEIGERHDVKIDDADRANSCGRQVKKQGASETASTNYEHARGQEPRLAGSAHFTEHNVSRVALKLLIGKCHGNKGLARRGGPWKRSRIPCGPRGRKPILPERDRVRALKRACGWPQCACKGEWRAMAQDEHHAFGLESQGFRDL